MWRHPPPRAEPITGRTIVAGFLVAAGLFVVLLAIDYPIITIAALAVVFGGSLLVRRLRRDRPLEIPGTSVGLQLTVSTPRDAASNVAECSIALVDSDDSTRDGRAG
ncbi:hypothetical protein [Natronorubrum sp. FCH18a]|uniref:hypothetical protein n=1 Tax=Natronorubrum sp. FCH18a TaxID=3447018 RepID=UPI003F51A59E